MPETLSLATAYASQIVARTHAMVEKWNMGDCDQFVEFYNCKAAKLIDADGRIVVGEEEVIDYLNITFEYANVHGRPPIQLKSKCMFDDGFCIIDVGHFSWHTIHKGSYAHKWVWMEDDWYLVEDYFTIEQSFVASSVDDEDKEN